MFPKRVIYRPGFPSHKEFRLHAKPITRLFYSMARSMGAGFVGFAIILILFMFGAVIKAQVDYRLNSLKPHIISDDGFSQLLEIAAQDNLSRQKAIEEAGKLGVDSAFSVVVPKLGIAQNIIANVSTADKNEYKDALKKGVAHAKGTGFPGQKNSIFLFAHSTDSPLNFARYNAVFYLLNKLATGDKINIFFTGKRYDYRVTKILIVPANDTSWLTQDFSVEALILQTCWPPGTTLKRLLVIAKRVG